MSFEQDTPTVHALLRLARLHPTADDLAFVAEHIAIIDWNELLRLAICGGIAGLIAQHLSELPVPRGILHRLIAHSLATEVSNRRQLAEALRLIALANERGLLLIPLKGTALQLGSPYANPAVRTQCDIDLLSPHEHVEPLDALLREQGYDARGEPGYSLRHQHHLKYSRLDGKQPLLVELHWTAFFGAYGTPAIDAQAIRRHRAKRWNGQTVPVLDPIDTLLSVALHLAIHRYRGQLKWLVDVAELLRANASHLDTTELWRRATTLGATRALQRVFDLATTLLDAPQPPRDRRSRLDPLLAALTPAPALVESRDHPAWTTRLAIDILLCDGAAAGLRLIGAKGRELLERYGQLELGSKRIQPDHDRSRGSRV